MQLVNGLRRQRPGGVHGTLLQASTQDGGIRHARAPHGLGERLGNGALVVDLVPLTAAERGGLHERKCRTRRLTLQPQAPATRVERRRVVVGVQEAPLRRAEELLVRELLATRAPVRGGRDGRLGRGRALLLDRMQRFVRLLHKLILASPSASRVRDSSWVVAGSC